MESIWVNDAVRNWKAAGIQLNSGASLNAIVETENKIGLLFPDDFKELYSKVNGFLDWDWTPTMFSLWPIERIIEEYDPQEKYEFVGFCDYLINSHCFGFIKKKAGVFKDYNTEEPTLMAPSFAETIQLINMDADIIY